MSRPLDPAGQWPGPGPAARLGLAGLALALPAWGAAATLFPNGAGAALAVHAAGTALAVRGMAATYPHDRVGGCNLVTTLRLALVAVVCAALADGGGASWAVAATAAAALALDGVDGHLARRGGLTSAFGARYDMEVDAALAAALALWAWAAGRAGPELLVLGFARYAFVAAGAALPWLGAALPGRWSRKAVCVVQIAALAALAAPVLPDAAARPMAVAAAGLVAWSFAVDIRWLAARR